MSSARTASSSPIVGQMPGNALFRQVFVVLRDEISRGVYDSSGALPKEEALGERFSVSRITVRRALAELAALGLVDRRHGLGTFVRRNGAVQRSAPSLDTVDALRQVAVETDVKLLEIERGVKPPPDIAQMLKVTPDAMAVHALIFHRATSEAIGTARLIPFSDMDMLQPIRQLLRENGLRARDHVPLATTAEISRFAISNQFRRRNGDNGSRSGVAPECRSNLPCLGLVQELLRQSVARGFTHWAAVMEPKLLRMLAAMGIHFTPVGPLVDHHGLRQPSYCNLIEMLERLKSERPDNWMVVTDAGALMPGLAEERRAA